MAAKKTQMTIAKPAVRRDPILRFVNTLEHPLQTKSHDILLVSTANASV